MRVVVQHESLGEIIYEESFWTGKKKLFIGGEELTKISKKTFQTNDGQILTLKGSYLSGVTLESNDIQVKLTPTVKWYEIVLSILPFILIMVWGNSVTLCTIIPVVGGAIGGAISGVAAVLNLFVIKGVNKVWLKILISVGVLILTFLICFLIALAIIAVAQA